MNFNSYQNSTEELNNFTSYNRDYDNNTDVEYQLVTANGLYGNSNSAFFYDNYEDDSNWSEEDFRDEEDLDQDEIGECDEFDDLDSLEELEDFNEYPRTYDEYDSHTSQTYPCCNRASEPYFNNYYPYIMPILFELEDDEDDFQRDPSAEEIDDILRKIETNNQEVYNLLALYNVPYPVAKKAFRKISKLTLTYGK